MPLADVEKVDFEVIVHGTTAALGGQAQRTLTPLHYRRTNFAAAYNAAAFITAFHTAVQTSWLNCVSVSWAWDKTSVRCINSPTEMTVESVVGLPGNIIGDMLPSYVAAVFSKLTGLRGRSYRGRMYLPGIPESGSTGNALTAPQEILHAALATVLDNQITDANGVTFIPIVLSRILSTLNSDPAVVVATPINTVQAKLVLGRLLSRKSITG